MFYATCCNPAGEFVTPAGRCGFPVTAHTATGPGLVVGIRRGQSVRPGAVCDGLVCAGCGECQGGLREAGVRASTGLGRCQAEMTIGREDTLWCDLEENHPELHWDAGAEVVWGGHTFAQEMADNPERDYRHLKT